MYVDIEYVVGYHNGRYHTIKHDKGEKQREAALAVVIVLAEKVEIEHKAEHEDTYVQHLPGQHQPLLADGFTALDGFFTQAFEDVVSFLG